MSAMKSVLVTGSRLGIGQAVTLKLLDSGYRVTGTSRNPASMNIGHRRFRALGLDLATICSHRQALEDFTAQCGDIDALVLNAGYGRFGGLEEFSSAQINDLLQVNLVAQIHLVRALISPFKRRGSGDIVFIGSESALSGGILGAVYSASKFGIRGFAQSLRKECAGRGVRVALINPGMVASSFFDELGFGPGPEPENSILPEQVADAVALILDSSGNMAWDEINLSPMNKTVARKTPMPANNPAASIDYQIENE